MILSYKSRDQDFCNQFSHAAGRVTIQILGFNREQIWFYCIAVANVYQSMMYRCVCLIIIILLFLFFIYIYTYRYIYKWFDAIDILTRNNCGLWFDWFPWDSTIYFDSFTKLDRLLPNLGDACPPLHAAIRGIFLALCPLESMRCYRILLS